MAELIYFGTLGIIVGSFLNVLVLRWGKQALSGRSACPRCDKKIAWYDLIPIVSWALLLGRCRACRARISIQYPLVEVGTGIIFALIGFAPLPLFARLLALPIAALLIGIAIYDLRTTYIPDAWVWTLNATAFISILAFPSHVVPGTWYISLLAGPITALPLYALWYFSHGAWMGFGDVKLALAIGWLLGIALGLEALLFAFILGAVVGIPLLALSSKSMQDIAHKLGFCVTKKAYTMKSEVPFGPFLAAATLIVWISNMYGFSAEQTLVILL